MINQLAGMDEKQLELLLNKQGSAVESKIQKLKEDFKSLTKKEVIQSVVRAFQHGVVDEKDLVSLTSKKEKSLAEKLIVIRSEQMAMVTIAMLIEAKQINNSSQQSEDSKGE